MKRSKRRQAGFTIIELLVATAVFAVVLVVITTAILQISRLYYKGVNLASTQATARQIMDTVAQAIQFSGGDVVSTVAGPATPSAPRAFCIGNERFTYALGWQLVEGTPDTTNNQTNHALVQDSYAGCSSSTTQPLNVPNVTGQELVAPGMRISKLSVAEVGPNLYRVEVRVVYGDNDLLDDATGPDAKCKSQRAGTQFCSVSDLSTTVIKRVQ